MRKLKLKIIVKMRKRDSFKENNDVDYNDDEYEDIGTVRKMKIGQEDEENQGLMRKLKLKIIVKMRKMDSFKENNDVDYNDDEYEDIGTVTKVKIGQEDEENED